MRIHRFRKPKLKVLSPKIRELIAQKKIAYHERKMQGKPTASTNQYLIAKKTTTYNLRKECRLTIAEKKIESRM